MITEHPLRRYRREKNLTLEALARDARVAKSTISRIERLHIAPSLGLVQRLVEITGLSATDFFRSEARQ